jgi:predicted nucleic acid-binding protein
MNRPGLAFVDTGIWSAFFSKPTSPEKHALDALLDEDRVSLTGPILAEVLRGFRRTDQADWVASRMRCAQYIEPSWEDSPDIPQSTNARDRACLVL